MAKVWFTADTHLHHTNIIKYCNRPFACVDDMDEFIIHNWNQRVGPDDDVYHLGDFAFGQNPIVYFERLNGARKFLIQGNHDRRAVLHLPWSGVYKSFELNLDGQSLFLHHHPIPDWKGKATGTWLLFAHCHGKHRAQPGSCDVGVDCHGFFPILLDEVRKCILKHGLEKF